MAPPDPTVWLSRNVVPDTVVVASAPLPMAPPPGTIDRPRLPAKVLLLMVRRPARAFSIAPPWPPLLPANVSPVRLTVAPRL